MYYTHLPFHLCLARRPWLIGDLSAPQRATPATAGQRSSVRLETVERWKERGELNMIFTDDDGL